MALEPTSIDDGIKDSGGPSDVAESLEGMKNEANALYADIKRAALDYEKGTAGEKLAKDKAKSFQS